jgi:hypothetical protein
MTLLLISMCPRSLCIAETAYLCIRFVYMNNHLDVPDLNPRILTPQNHSSPTSPTPNNFHLPKIPLYHPFFPGCLVGWINRCVCVTSFPGGSVEWEGRYI